MEMVTCVVQARMGSERLPGKVMKKLGENPMIMQTVRRINQAGTVDNVIVATSDREADDVLADYLRKSEVEVYRADENNVLKRYVDCLQGKSSDIVIRITGDCPYIDPVIIDNVVTYFKMNTFDYVRLDVPNTFVRGFDVEVFSRAALERVYEITKSIEGDSPYKEHVTYYMYMHQDEFSVGYVEGSELYRKNYRLCVDTIEDFQLVTKIYEHFKDEYVLSKDIIKYLDENPIIAATNIKVEQKKS